MSDYPEQLTTSDWVDYLETLTTREEKIACLATYHRRISYQAAQTALAEVVSDDTKVQKAITDSAEVIIGRLVTPVDYQA